MRNGKLHKSCRRKQIENWTLCKLFIANVRYSLRFLFSQFFARFRTRQRIELFKGPRKSSQYFIREKHAENWTLFLPLVSRVLRRYSRLEEKLDSSPSTKHKLHCTISKINHRENSIRPFIIHFLLLSQFLLQRRQNFSCITYRKTRCRSSWTKMRRKFYRI